MRDTWQVTGSMGKGDHQIIMEASNMKTWYAVATGLRLALVLYGEWQDHTMAVKFTDVDYYVFNDAAKFVTMGQSPYNRATFRYTPLLAWALTPNIFLHPFFGKLLFILFDVLSGSLIFTILKNNGCSGTTSTMSSLLWLLNPLPMVVSSRGNAESVMAYLVLQTISLLQRRKTVLAALMYALAVHVKIYPVTYALAVYLYLDHEEGTLDPKTSVKEMVTKKTDSSVVVRFLWSLRPTWNRIKFGLVAGVTLVLLTAVFYVKYGWIFLYETYLYHIVRKDIRHNFSPYFYMLYLTAGDETSFFIKFLTFCPQILLLVAIALRFHKDLPLSCFLCTFTFVMLNKVCTSQYFLWYLCLLPLLVPRLTLTWWRTAVLSMLWFLAQGLWLLPAYYLEFEGQNTFIYIWLAGLFFFTVNVFIVFTIILHYDYKGGHLTSSKAD
ncbi:GPI alpha-1,4-mannosyltransferase I, catalytic subunit-like isoform X2 [Babylonia areolata]|uniref:GPI alpha-1,4-mannosyltransferase I, catalytic subunit-like isoform X2 n=1 Tax=Babylonia areolata TaxID=304850 RepID=UPI003FD56C99